MDMEKIRSVVAEKSARSNILVVGDVMLDKYYTGEVTRISPEAPVPITHVTGTRETLGGAANVAHNLALLGTNVSIAGYVRTATACWINSNRAALTMRGSSIRSVRRRRRSASSAGISR